jgi:hypothetical protein
MAPKKGGKKTIADRDGALTVAFEASPEQTSAGFPFEERNPPGGFARPQHLKSHHLSEEISP